MEAGELVTWVFGTLLGLGAMIQGFNIWQSRNLASLIQMLSKDYHTLDKEIGILRETRITGQALEPIFKKLGDHDSRITLLESHIN